MSFQCSRNLRYSSLKKYFLTTAKNMVLLVCIFVSVIGKRDGSTTTDISHFLFPTLNSYFVV